MVLTLADLPALVEELDAIQLPNQYVAENLIIARVVVRAKPALRTCSP